MEISNLDYNFLYPIAEDYYKNQVSFTYTENIIINRSNTVDKYKQMVESLLMETESKSEIKYAIDEFVSEYRKNPNDKKSGEIAGKKLHEVFNAYIKDKANTIKLSITQPRVAIDNFRIHLKQNLKKYLIAKGVYGFIGGALLAMGLFKVSKIALNAIPGFIFLNILFEIVETLIIYVLLVHNKTLGKIFVFIAKLLIAGPYVLFKGVTWLFYKVIGDKEETIRIRKQIRDIFANAKKDTKNISKSFNNELK